MSLGNTQLEPNASSQTSSISSDGRYVAFSSYAENLVSNDTNGIDDVFVYDRTTDTVEIINVSNTGEQSNGSSLYTEPIISSNGRYVAFSSDASNLVPNDTNGVRDVFVYDRNTHIIERVSLNNSGVEGNNQSYLLQYLLMEDLLVLLLCDKFNRF
ncbi:MAG: hypothetical protein R3B55_02995 [Candidatus Paceibacterota bacterium]